MGLLFTACTRVSDEPAPGSPSERGEPRVENLTIDEPSWAPDGSNWALVLRWDPPAAFETDHYVLTRDGIVLDRELAATRWIDRDAEPGTRVSYSVRAVDATGATSLRARVSLRTSAPALSRARLDGSFVMRMRVEHASGTRDHVTGGAVVFHFAPLCREGPCSVRWTVEDRRTQAVLARDGDAYVASATTPLFVTGCDGSVIDEIVRVRLRVNAAAPLRGAWRATAIEGTVEESTSSSGCLPASIDWSVRGALGT